MLYVFLHEPISHADHDPTQSTGATVGGMVVGMCVGGGSVGMLGVGMVDVVEMGVGCDVGGTVGAAVGTLVHLPSPTPHCTDTAPT